MNRDVYEKLLTKIDNAFDELHDTIRHDELHDTIRHDELHDVDDYETVTSYRSLEDGLEVRTGYDLAKLTKLLKEYDLTVEDFQEYGRRMKGEVSG